MDFANFDFFFAHFEEPFTPQTWLRSGSNFAKTCFRRFLTFHFSTPKNFCWRIYLFSKMVSIFFQESCVLEELGIFERHWQIPRRKSLPVVRLFFLYEPWRRGKSNRLCFWSGFWPEHDFNFLPFFFFQLFYCVNFFWRIMRFGGARIFWASPADSSSTLIACSSFIFSLRALAKG